MDVERKEVFEQKIFCVLHQDCQKIEHKSRSLLPDTINASKFSVVHSRNHRNNIFKIQHVVNERHIIDGCFQSRSQDFAKGGGAFLKLETILNEVDSNYHQVLNQIETFFCPKSGDLKKKGLRRNSERFPVQNQVISKKKVFAEIQSVFLSKIR